MQKFFWKPSVGLAIILFFYFLVTIYTSWTTPLSVGPDEVAHFSLARFIKKEGRLPYTEDDRQLDAAGFKWDQPPLNAVLIATAFFWDDLQSPPFVKLTHGNPRRHLVQDGVVDHTGRAHHIVNTEDPLAGDFLFWRFGRLMSTIFSMGTLIVIYFIGLKIFEDRSQKHWWALSAVMCIAFIPTFVFISGMFSYENLLGFWLSLYILVAVHLIKGNQSYALFLLAGLFVGLAIVTKLSALLIPINLLVLISVLSYLRGWPGREYLQRLTLSGVGLLAGCGWWFVWIETKFNWIAKEGLVGGLLRPLVSDNISNDVFRLLTGQAASGVRQVSPSKAQDWIQAIYRSYWSFYGKDQDLTLSILFWVTMLVLVGLIWTGFRRQKTRLWLGFFGFYLLLLFILPWIRLQMTGFSSLAGQGQHILFPAAGVFAILTAWGLSTYFPKHISWGWVGPGTLGLGLLVWSTVLALFVYSQPTPVPVRTVPPIMPSTATALALDFGPMVLEGYELTTDNLNPQVSLGVTLYWTVEEFIQEDYLTTMKLVDSQGEAQSIWVGYGANGRYPSRAWEPGDIIRDELYLPLAGVQPGIYTLILETNGGQSPLVMENGSSILTLAQVDLNDIGALPDDLTTAGKSEFILWLAGQKSNQRPVVRYWSTLQITANSDMNLQLIGPDQVTHDPVAVAGDTHVFVIDPLWSRGTYGLLLRSNDQLYQKTLPVLTVQGWRRQAEMPSNQTAIEANFANYIELLGYNLPKSQLAPNEPLSLILNWHALQTIPTDFIMFTRVYDDAGNLWGGYDRWPREYYSPLMWVAGEVIEDGFTLEIDPEAPAGLYYLDVGWYLVVGQAPVSLPLMQDGKLSDVTHVTIGPFRIEK